MQLLVEERRQRKAQNRIKSLEKNQNRTADQEARLIRAEYMKHTSREYVLAAKAIGVSHFRRMFVHIFPNVSHIALVQISILVVAFIKSEVILSFLGFGVPVGVVSWGSMLNEAQSELIYF